MFTNNNMSTNLIDQLLIEFHALTDMKICIFDASGKEIGYYPERFSSFCGKLRKNKDLDNACRLCDKNAISECRATKTAKIYTCHAGLTECVSPIIVAGVIRGFIAFGQIRQDDALTKSKMTETLFPHLKKEYRSLPLISKRKIQAAAHVLEVCASYEQLKSFATTLESNLTARIEEFVQQNIANNLKIETLCRHFHCSRKEFYSIIKGAYNCTPAEFVKLRRLKFACELLKTTNNSISKIGALCGIEDYNYFSKVFKKHLGVSPREYRNSNTF